LSGRAIAIESRWGPADLDQMLEDTLQFVAILNDGDDFHPTTIPEGKVVGFISAPHFGHTIGSTS
jgi:hypothetical protein